MNKKTTAIILGGGAGARMDARVPKQFLELNRKPLIMYAIERFQHDPHISDIVVVCHEDFIRVVEERVKSSGLEKVRSVVPGGKTRQGSSRAGIAGCPDGTELVLIHDAVRPFISSSVIKAVLEAAAKTGAAGPALDMDDTVISEKDGLMTAMIDRKELRRMQTPQGFLYDTIHNAHEWAVQNNVVGMSDDCGLVMMMSGKVQIVKGSTLNMKITTKSDLFLAEELIKAGKVEA